MSEFKTVLRGYDKKEVDRYLAAVSLKSKSGEDTLKERIGILEEEIIELNSKLEVLQGRENKLNVGILRIAEMEESAKRKMDEQTALERERLELFKNKWTEYAVNSARQDHPEVIECLDNYLFEYTQKVKSVIEEGLAIKSTPPIINKDGDGERLAALCRKLGILEE